MKSEYQFESISELTPEMWESIKTICGNHPVRLTIETIDKSKEKSNFNNNKKNEIAETIIDAIFDKLNKRNS